MGYGYPQEVVQDFIEDYAEEWGVLLPFEDALLAKYEGEADDDSPLATMTSSLHRR
jgi:hypothetical protein